MNIKCFSTNDQLRIWHGATQSLLRVVFFRLVCFNRVVFVQLLPVASFFQLRGLQRSCERKLSQSVTLDNAVDVYQTAKVQQQNTWWRDEQWETVTVTQLLQSAVNISTFTQLKVWWRQRTRCRRLKSFQNYFTLFKTNMVIRVRAKHFYVTQFWLNSLI